MGLLDKREYWKPFDYPEFYDIWIKAQASHWSPFEIQLSSDVTDWKQNLTEAEKNVIGNILKSFSILEVHVEDYWASKIGRYFKKPEIQAVAHTFAAQESIHTVGYSYLNDELGLTDYKGFLRDPTAYNKINRLLSTKGKTKADIARSLAIFSAFTEGVSLFGSFVVLLSFSKRNLLKNTAQIIAWSVLDEQLHSDTGIKLFNILKQEYPEIWTDELKRDLYDAARLTIKLEDDFLDKMFELGDIEGILKNDVKALMRFRANMQLKKLGLKSNWNNVDQEAIARLSWFETMVFGENTVDFFAARETAYSKNVLIFDDAWGE